MPAVDIPLNSRAYLSSLRPREWGMHAVLVAAAYYVVGRLGLLTPEIAPHVALVWPAFGVALAALLRLGLGTWAGIGLGSALLAMSGANPPWLGLVLSLGNTLGPLTGAWLLRREGFHVDLDRRRDLWLLGVIGLGAATLVSATAAALALMASGSISWPDAPKVWLCEWLSQCLGALFVGVPLLTLSRASLRQAFGQWRWLPSSLLAFGAVASASLGAMLADGARAVQSPLLFLPHLLLCWLAARGGLFVGSATALLLNALTVWASVQGIGPFANLEEGQGVAMLVGYACSVLAIPLLAAVLIGEITSNEKRWLRALDASQIGVCEWDLATGHIEFSSRWDALLAHATQGSTDGPPSFWSLIHPDDAAEVQRAFEPLKLSDAGSCKAECRMRSADGSWRPFELNAQVVERSSDGKAARILTTARDIGELLTARERRELAQSAIEHLNEGLLITDAQHRVLEANSTFLEITGYSREELLGAVPLLLREAEPGTDFAEQQASMRAGLEAQHRWHGEMSHPRRGGESRLLHVTITAIRNADGAVRNHVLTVSDITHSRQQLEQLRRQAHFDELTRLPNRVRLAQMLQAAMQASRRQGSLLTVCYLDLDHFKPVNDRFGHEAGDRLLSELANRMRRSLRSWAGGDDVVARIGGDEFVLLLRTATLEESRHAVERVLNQVCQPYALGVGAGPVVVTASIGATVFPLDGADAETLLRHADHAMYGAKQAGRNGYLFFDAEHDRRAEARFVALGRVQEALDANEFRLHFQPKVDMRNAKVLGVEALLRWKHPDLGVIAPSQFLPLIENTGLSISVGNWVLQQGIDQLAHWLRMGLDITVSVNVSARHLQEPLFAQHLAGLLSRHNAPVAHRLIIEVLETAALADVDYTCSLMEECRALGVRFALDDFGTGYSTFTYLKRLPIDMLKIDRSFVINMLGDRQDLAIVEGVIGLSETFGCTVVAEGVENQAQAQRLIEIGCDVGQGNGIAAAMPADEVMHWVRDYKGMPVSPELFVPV